MKGNKGRWVVGLLVIAILIVIGVRFWSYFSLSIPLGYDHGLYRTFFLMVENQLPYIDFGQLPTWIKAMYEPLSGMIYITLHSISGITADMVLLWGVGILHLIISLFVYLLLRKQNKQIALLGVLLYLTSIIQYQVFWWGYVKQILGVIFILTAYYLIEKKSYRLLIPILTGLFTVNRAGGVFFLISFVIYKIIVLVREKSRTWKDILSVAIAGILSLGMYFPVLKEQVFSLFAPMFGSILRGEQSGTFFDVPTYIMYNIIWIGLSILGCVVWWSKQMTKKIPLEFVGFTVGILRIGLQLFFYNRMLGYLDIFVIILATYGLTHLVFSTEKTWKYIGIGLYFLQALFFVVYVHKTNFPLIVPQEFASIQTIPTIITPDTKIMVTDKKYSAFIMGYAGHNVMARGLFDADPRTNKQWEYRHMVDGTEKCQLLATLTQDQRPEYLWIGSLQPKTSLSGATCLTKLLGDTTYGFYLLKYTNE